MANYISRYNLNLTYSDSWVDGGNSMSGPGATKFDYVELYNTTVWDRMLQVRQRFRRR